MDGYRFRSLEELYQKLLPAFSVKVSELKRMNVKNINERDIWHYLKHTYWINKKDLTLGDMVNDIITISSEELIKNIDKERN